MAGAQTQNMECAASLKSTTQIQPQHQIQHKKHDIPRQACESCEINCGQVCLLSPKNARGAADTRDFFTPETVTTPNVQNTEATVPKPNIATKAIKNIIMDTSSNCRPGPHLALGPGAVDQAAAPLPAGSVG